MKKNTIFTVAMLAAVVSSAWAQTTVPTGSPLEIEKQRIELQRKKLFDASNPATQPKAFVLPSTAAMQTEMQKVEVQRKDVFDPNNPATKNAKNSFPNIATPETSGVDIQALAKRYEKRADARKVDDLMIFVSFTMPPESLKRVVAQAYKVGGTVVLNGFKDNSLKATALAIKGLGEASGNVVINPNAFTKYKVKSVPAVVLAKADSLEQIDPDGCALPDAYVSVAGDVSLDYSLEQMAQRDPKFAELANRYNRQLKGR